VTRLRNDSLPSKVIILLTDGVSMDGDITPEEAANLAKSKNIKVYTIGVGSRGTAPSPQFTPFGVRYVDEEVEIDEVTLMKIAKITDGQYFRATDEASLRSIYEQINQLEKRKIKTIDYKSEPPTTPLPFLNWALVLTLLAWIFQIIYFKTNG
jgi:Ca-activated chloride channel family protein